ncbi:carboxymuconolactone decarboxylase family protein [Demequina capsici]|uniref:Carboxymuconolactone decarboxylase family protein n=1 Tax=Demequina capsici TaxID=3075620 RepID=A0AA96J8K8_9MICO|nr:carboxymuconolactone decarboxylase family protein [Demequina sp. OYTSA14]WNM25575.1 carboxymuconolactone decarboxylase family protein [Demequina sp. OYTSA14]
MGRVPDLTPERLDAEARALYDAIAGGPRAAGPQHFALTRQDGSLRGPFNAMLLAPGIGGALQEVGAALRYRGSLNDRAREIAILLVAAHWRSAFEQESHEAVGRAHGLTDHEIEALRMRDASAFSGVEAAVADAVLALLAGDLDDEAWATAEAALGAEVVFELTALVGYYATLALQLRVFRVVA